MELKIQAKLYLNYCEHRKALSPKTLKAYRIDLRQFFDFFESEEPCKEEIESYITWLHEKFKQQTVKRKIASIKAFYNYLEEEGIIEDSPLRKIRMKFKENIILPKIIPRHEIEKLLSYMYNSRKKKERKHKYILRNIAVVEVLFATGARVYEISNISRNRVDLESGIIRIMGKGGKERYLPIGDSDVIELLKEYYIHNKEAIERSGYFFTNRNGRRFTEDAIRIMIKKYTKLAGIERHITPHMFRHSCATYLIEEGVDISCVQRIMGHSSIKTTQIYIHIAMKEQIEILKNKHPRRLLKVRSVA